MFSFKKWFGFYFRSDWFKATGLVLLGFVSGSSPNIIQNLNNLSTYLNLIAGSLLLCYARILNDYFDTKIDQEENHITPFINKYKEVLILFLLHLPLIIASCIFCITIPTMSAVIAFSLFVFFAVTYSIPKIRIRNKPLLGFLWNPFLALSIFSGVFLIYSKVNYEFLIIAVGISLFYFFSEILHQLDHYEIDKEDGRRTLVTLWGKEYTRGLAKKLSWLIIPLGVFWGILFFLEVQWGILFSIIFFINSWRVLKLMNIKPNNKIKKVRSSFGGKIEMILYIIYFLMKPFIL